MKHENGGKAFFLEKRSSFGDNDDDDVDIKHKRKINLNFHILICLSSLMLSNFTECKYLNFVKIISQSKHKVNVFIKLYSSTLGVTTTRTTTTTKSMEKESL